MAADGLLVVHGGGPTAVINASLYGAVDEALNTAEPWGASLGARGGVGGITDGNLVDFGQVPRDQLDLLPFSPSSAIGTSRKPLEDEDYRELAHALRPSGHPVASVHRRQRHDGHLRQDLARLPRGGRAHRRRGHPQDHGQRHRGDRPRARLR